jgi:hypothetical protein
MNMLGIYWIGLEFEVFEAVSTYVFYDGAAANLSYIRHIKTFFFR